MTSGVMSQMARERALQMARSDWQNGVIARDDMLTQARLYEAYLTGRPIAISYSAERGQSRSERSES